jgi:hypothetical protein
MAIPMYGQNKQGEALDAISQFKKTHKIFDIYVDTDSPDNNADTSIAIPAGSIVTGCVITNLGPTALDSGAKTLDLNGTDLTASAASLAVNACVGMDATLTPIHIKAAANILVDANIYTGSSYTTLRVIVEYYSPEEFSDTPSLVFGAGTD